MSLLPPHLEFFLRETFINVRRNGLMSLAAVSTVFIGLCIGGAFYLAAVNLHQWSEHLSRRVEILVPLRDGLSAEDTRAVRGRLEQLPGVDSVHFVSRHEALQQLQEQLGRQVDFSDFESNPLFDSFDVRVTDPQLVPTTAAHVKQIRGVDAENVDYGERLTDVLLTLRRLVWLIGSVAGSVLAVAILLIVSNTIRLTVFARRREIRLMQLVGATNRFIRVPFMLEGVFHGVVGATAACAALTVVYHSLARWSAGALPFLPLAHGWGLLPPFWAGLLAAGVTFGWAGSILSLRRFFAQV